jgi:hypothetical protein
MVPCNKLALRPLSFYHSSSRKEKAVVNMRFFLLTVAVLAMLIFCPVFVRSQTVITFDDMHETGSGSYIPNGYQGLVWSNFACLNAFLVGANFPPFQSNLSNGYYNGMVSASNVAYNAFGGDAEIDSVTNFNFLGAYLTGAWSSNLNIEVRGFNGTNLVYDETKVASATNPTLFAFDYLNIDRLYFNAYGGEDAGFPPSDGQGGTWFVMDNFMFEFIPEPSSFLLAALGGVSLIAFLRRKRGQPSKV